MEIESRGLPLHSDATVKIRPRIFLEGNWFVELQPGSPSTKTLSSGATLPSTQSSDPVQLDQVLDALNTDTRANLQDFLIGYGDGLTRKPSKADDAEQDPEVRGVNAAASAQQSLRARAGGRARRRDHQPGDRRHRTARPVQARAEHRQSDLRAERARAAARRTDRQLQHASSARSPTARRACAQPSPCCRARCATSTTACANSTARSRRRKTFATDILPGVKNTPQTVTATLPWIAQVRSLAGAERARRRGQGACRQRRRSWRS